MIARAFGFKGVRAAQYHLEALEAAGAHRAVSRDRARGIRVLHAPKPPAGRDRLRAGLGNRSCKRPTPCACLCSARSLPVSPIGADIGSPTNTSCSTACCSPLRPITCCSVKGDSMRDEGIFDGDLIGVHRTPPRRAARARSWSPASRISRHRSWRGHGRGRRGRRHGARVAHAHRAWHRGVHEPRAGSRSAGRQARRHLGVRLRAVRAAYRATARSRATR